MLLLLLLLRMSWLLLDLRCHGGDVLLVLDHLLMVLLLL